ncbi:four helix bundle protein [Candidatus Gracilibacteria bacterium]|nr:four helix bundle protein [Candidatus Gracilibacteria bacterium]
MSEKENILQQKTFSFVLDIIQLCNELSKKAAPVLVQSVFQSGTEIGAFIEETKGRQSAQHFYASIQAAYNSAQKTNYWLELLAESKLVEQKKGEELLADNDALIRIMGKTLSTLRKKAKEKAAE